ncbi:hypothetical protein [Spirosoma litoris]
MKTVLLFLLLCPFVVRAQLFKISPEDTQRKHSYILMRDGSVVRGQVLRQDTTVISIRKGNGDMTFVEADQVLRISAGHIAQVSENSAVGSTVFVLKDGTQLPGTFIRRDNTMITVRKSNGQLTYFEPELLLRVDTVRNAGNNTGLTVSGKPAYANRFSPFLLLNPTAFNPEKGRFYYRNTLLVLNELDYGITQNWSIGLNVNPAFGQFQPDNTARETIFGANVRFLSKLSFPIGEQFRFGINTTYQPKQKGYFSSISQQLTFHGLLSFGDGQRNATLGYGLLIYPDYTTNNTVPFITAGVMHKISRNLTILSDNTFYPNPFYGGKSADLSIALRFDRLRHAFDIGVFSSLMPYYNYYASYPGGPKTQAYFYPYLAYNLIIGKP